MNRQRRHELESDLRLNNAIVCIDFNVRHVLFTVLLKLHKETFDKALLQHKDRKCKQWSGSSGVEVTVSRHFTSLIYVPNERALFSHTQ